MTTSAPLLEKLKNSHNTTNQFGTRTMSEIIMSKTLNMQGPYMSSWAFMGYMIYQQWITAYPSRKT